MKPKKNSPPSLKSASGAGFTFEDKVGAILLCEMLAGTKSIGATFGPIERLERQAGDWEPFGDLLLDVRNHEGKVVHCGGSVKSNRPITANGCDPSLCSGIWSVFEKQVFSNDDFLLLCCAPLSPKVSDHLSSLCQQARLNGPDRLEKKISHLNIRRIFDSFRDPRNKPESVAPPGNALSKLVFREFDFESLSSRSEAEALKLCRDNLDPDNRTDSNARDLWMRLCAISEELRIHGGSVMRSALAAKLQDRFHLLDDQSDLPDWSRIRELTRLELDQIQTTLPGNLKLPRKQESEELASILENAGSCHLLGDSGCGKSSLVKNYCETILSQGGEVVWIKAESLPATLRSIPKMPAVLARSRCPKPLLVIDALEGSPPETLQSSAQLIKLLQDQGFRWQVVIVCQTPDWARVCVSLIKHLSEHPVIKSRLECGPLNNEDFTEVCRFSGTAAKLGKDPKLRRFLSSPKILDVILSAQMAENRTISGEADLIEWWWNLQVRGSNFIAAEEKVARDLASQMADDLRTEISPDKIAGFEAAAGNLIRNRILKRTRDGLLRFEHDLLADWARVMHLRSLGDSQLEFIASHTENPPWLRAIRLLSQYLLDRTGDLNRWRELINTSMGESYERNEEPIGQKLQAIDALLEGLIFSSNAKEQLRTISTDLFSRNGYLLRRLLRRLMLVSTTPDPVVYRHMSQLNEASAAFAAEHYRLPMGEIWSPLIAFLAAHPQETIEMAAIEISEIGEMWGRLQTYVAPDWTELADLIIKNAEAELRREISEKYYVNSRPRSLSRGDRPRRSIYAAALMAATQIPQRAEKLLSKASGTAPWEADDISEVADDKWIGDWREPTSFIARDSYVDTPPQSWPFGPSRRTSRDFCHAWLNASSAIHIYRNAPEIACEATLGFLLAWPKETLFNRDLYRSDIDRHGFAYEADDMYPPFYSKGPFLAFLRENWKPALELILKLVNFATDRYSDWWPYESKVEIISFPFEDGNVAWSGNHQIYAWFQFNMNTVDIIACCLMALEKWLEEEVDSGNSLEAPINAIFTRGRSLALGGVLIALGKRRPHLFTNTLKPLLFQRALYLLDLQATNNYLGPQYGNSEGNFINKLRQEWGDAPGRRRDLFDFTGEWFVTKAEFKPILSSVSAHWKAQAAKLPEHSEERIPLLRWAATFDIHNWEKVTLSNGSIGWKYEQPEELQDQAEFEKHAITQQLISIPYQCNKLLQNRKPISPNDADSIWSQLRNWAKYEKVSIAATEEEETSSSFYDHRHAKSGFIAVLLCLGDSWLNADTSRRDLIEEELLRLLSSPPKTMAFTPDDRSEDCEAFLARCVVRCWINNPSSEQWRHASGTFVTCYRYHTVRSLFDEAFRARNLLAVGYRDLEALVLSFASARRKARSSHLSLDQNVVARWSKKWLPGFAKGRGPVWQNNWGEPAPRNPSRKNQGAPVRPREDYRIDIYLMLSAFEELPSLHEADNDTERTHWLNICKQMLAAYIETLPPSTATNSRREWNYDIYTSDERIIQIVVSRIFQCTATEQRDLWLPILNLPPACHHHICYFLRSLLIEALRQDPPRILQLAPLWRAGVDHLLASPPWAIRTRGRHEEVWKILFLYGSTPSTRDRDHAPLVAALYDLYESHVRTLFHDAYDQSLFARFLTSESGEQLLVESLGWLSRNWEEETSYFWVQSVEDGGFEVLLKHAWQRHLPSIRRNPDAFKAFKLLTLNLASHHISIAIEIQQQIGND